jgi:hypothetical protein
MPFVQVQGFVKERIAVWTRHRGLLAGQREGNFKVGVVPVQPGEEVLPGNPQQGIRDSLGPKIPPNEQPPDLFLTLMA